MAKLWQKTTDLDETIERFTAGEDVTLDLGLAEFDVLGSIAHARMLAKIGILSEAELAKLQGELVKMLAAIERGEFTIRTDQEDVHTAVEERLTEAVGDAGKKIHTARSRNDQAALDCRLYARAKTLELRAALIALARTCLAFAERHREVPMVGRTHTQRAMPSSVGLWASAVAEAMLENDELLAGLYPLVNRSPLGSAASYGVAVPIDRELTAKLLGFERPVINVLYANNTRGKVEAELLAACAVVMTDLARAATDIILFSIPETGYFDLPERFCPGSSIMPQKRTPGPLELIRARAA
ncbi:MAG TPA: lyase family protein, partial [Planctomycetota bacterium]|nr:lyase family protein [Planctomycetota bacterium]